MKKTKQLASVSTRVVFFLFSFGLVMILHSSEVVRPRVTMPMVGLDGISLFVMHENHKLIGHEQVRNIS